MFATLIDGEADLSDFFYALAVVFFLVAFVIRARASSIDGCLVALGLAATAAGLLVL